MQACMSYEYVDIICIFCVVRRIWRIICTIYSVYYDISYDAYYDVYNVIKSQKLSCIYIYILYIYSNIGCGY